MLLYHTYFTAFSSPSQLAAGFPSQTGFLLEQKHRRSLHLTSCFSPTEEHRCSPNAATLWVSQHIKPQPVLVTKYSSGGGRLLNPPLVVADPNTQTGRSPVRGRPPCMGEAGWGGSYLQLLLTRLSISWGWPAWAEELCLLETPAGDPQFQQKLQRWRA